MSRSTTMQAMMHAIRDFMVQGNSITRLEALIFFGCSNLMDIVRRLRNEGWLVQSHRVPYAKALRRVNEECKLEVPKTLPIREITLTDYWIER